MSRYIDADKIIYTWLIDNDGKEHDGVTLQSVIDMMPTADVRENVKAQRMAMQSKGGTCWYECSNCHTPIDDSDVYCRHCGAEIQSRIIGKESGRIIIDETWMD